jgi:hypothetical protein
MRVTVNLEAVPSFAPTAGFMATITPIQAQANLMEH